MIRRGILLILYIQRERAIAVSNRFAKNCFDRLLVCVSRVQTTFAVRRVLMGLKNDNFSLRICLCQAPVKVVSRGTTKLNKISQ